MKHHLRRLGLWTCLLALWLAPSRAAESNPTPNAVIIALKGRVKIKHAQSTTFVPATTNLVLAVGDIISTGDRASATLKLADESVARVNELTQFAIRAPGPTGGQAEIEFRKGDKGGVHFFDREGRPTGITTATASGAIVGTEFAVRVAENGATTISVLEGRVDLSNDLGTVQLTSNEQGVVEPGQAPVESPMLDVIAPIQWTLYYPAVLDPAAIPDVSTELHPARAAYIAGDLLAALAQIESPGAPPTRNQDALFLAQMALAAGQPDQALELLGSARSAEADALTRIVATVRGQKLTPVEPTTATAAIAESYAAQADNDLDRALRHARQAVHFAPDFGAAHARIAELEFAHGRSGPARVALVDALRLSARNAQALALQGFVLASRHQVSAAKDAFEIALAADPHLGNAWLGRGLCRIKLGDLAGGRQDLQVAAAMEPNRAVARSYLGKAYAAEHDLVRARTELSRARELDPADPTSWLYGALLAQQENRVNAAVTALETSRDLNDNRALYRSRQLLDQDQAVRGANLASVYRDAGLTEVSVREASRAVASDYANASAHLFLANSYDALRDPREFNLRYETPWFSELLVANLLAPVGAGPLSQNVSLQEYSDFFERDRVGVTSLTEWFSGGDWTERGSLYGTFGGTSFAIDSDFRSETGRYPNSDVWRSDLYAKFKQQVSERDTLFVEALRTEKETGDTRSTYDPLTISRTFEVTDKQDPNLFAGWHRNWQPGQDTLLLVSRLSDETTLREGSTYGRTGSGPARPADQTYLDQGSIPLVLYPTPTDPNPAYIHLDDPALFDRRYRANFTAWSTELQHIATLDLGRGGRHTLIAGGRYQMGDGDATADLLARPGQSPHSDMVFMFITNSAGQRVPIRVAALPPTNQFISYELGRAAAYFYDTWQPLNFLELIGGITYDWVDYPVNVSAPPFAAGQLQKERYSPKVGLRWTPLPRTQFRAAWTRSLGGVFYDTSVRLEPVQVAGFTQAYRSLTPESFSGNVPGTSFQTVSGAIDHQLPTRTYLGITTEWLTSEAEQTVGAYQYYGDLRVFYDASSLTRALMYDETTLGAYINQLIGEDWSLGLNYRVSEANQQTIYPAPLGNTPTATSGSPNSDLTSTLHQVNGYGQYTHSCGAYIRFNTRWVQQSNSGYRTPLPGEDFWQQDVFVGYRFLQRRAEIRVGVLNLTDTDYQLSPLNIREEFPRERTYYASLRLQF